MYLIIDGTAEVVSGDGDQLGTLSKHQFVGSMAFLRFMNSMQEQENNSAQDNSAEIDDEYTAEIEQLIQASEDSHLATPHHHDHSVQDAVPVVVSESVEPAVAPVIAAMVGDGTTAPVTDGDVTVTQSDNGAAEIQRTGEPSSAETEESEALQDIRVSSTTGQ